jgi:hypothetical protein
VSAKADVYSFGI